MSRRAPVASVLLLLAAAMPAAPAAATNNFSVTPAGKWLQVTAFSGQGRNTDEVGRARTPDGVLHLDWTEKLGGNAERVVHTAVAANAKTVTGPDEILSYPGGSNNRPGLIAEGGTLRAFFAGLSAGSPIDSTLATATSTDGKTWAVRPKPSSNEKSPSPVYAAAGIAGLDNSGLLISIWGDSSPSGGAFHFGDNEITPDQTLGDDLGQIDPNLAEDTVSQASFAGWNFIGEPGAVVIRPINPPGPQVSLPNSGATQTQTRLKMTGRIGAPGVYVAYTIGTNQFLGRPALIRVGATKPLVASAVTGGQDVGVAAAPEGRLWVFYHRSGRIYARRSNESVTTLGAAVGVTPPGRGSIYTLDGEASLGPLDLLANVETGGKIAFYNRRLLPGLSLKLSPKGVSSSTGGTVRATVRDAGDPVAGATVRLMLKGQTLQGTTTSKGQVKLSVPQGTKPGVRLVSANKSGYTGARAGLRVRK